MKKLLTVLLILLTIFSVSAQSSKEKNQVEKPWINSNIFNNWKKVNLEDSYELYVNYDAYMKALKNNVKNDSHYTRSGLALEKAIISLIEDTSKTSDEIELLRGYYALFTDIEKRNKEGNGPLMFYVDLVRKAKTTEDMSDLLQTGMLFGDLLAHFDVVKASDNPSKYGVYVKLSLPISSRMQEPTDEEVAASMAAINDLLLYTDYTEDFALEMTEQILALEQYVLTDEESTQDFTLDEIKDLCTPLYDLIIGLGYTSDDYPVCYTVEDSESFRLLQNLYTDENLEVFKAIFTADMAGYAINFLEADTEDTTDAAWAFINNYLKGALDQAYIEFNFPFEVRDLVQELTDSYIQAMRNRILSEDWLSDATKAKAVEKIDNMVSVVVYPDDWIDFSDLLELVQYHDQNLLDAVLCRDDFYRDYFTSFLGQDIKRGDWVLTDTATTEANAYYMPGENSINILAGILYEGLYSDKDIESLLGTIGATIGHEITHGFDVSGSDYDAFGNYENWWTDEDKDRFTAKAQVIMDQMENIILLSDGYHQSGEQVIDEIVADLGGLALSLDVAKQYENFDYDKFFRAYAYAWYSIIENEEQARESYENDSHPADYVRANYVVQQFDEFYKTYPSVQPGTAMYVSPENRVSIW